MRYLKFILATMLSVCMVLPSTLTAFAATYTITTSIDHGTITPSTTINTGESKTISFAAEDGYVLDKVYLDDVEQTWDNNGVPEPYEDYVSGQFSISNPNKNHVIRVTTKEDPDAPPASVTITTSIDSNGTITPTSTLPYGSNKVVEFTANDGYVLDKVYKNGVEYSWVKDGKPTNFTGSKSGTLTFTSIIDDVNIVVTTKEYIIATYSVSYTYSGTLPDEVMATLPATTIHIAGDIVTAIQPSATTIKVGHKIYTFNGWDSSSVTVTNANTGFVGSWSVTNDPTYKVSYSYSGTLPSEVMTTLPSDSKDYYNGDVITPAAPSMNEIIVDNKKYTFNGWDKSSITVNNSNISFVGSWSVENINLNPEYSVLYTYSNANLPDEVKITLPKDNNKYKAGNTVFALTPTNTKITVGGVVYEFKGWDKDSDVVESSDITFVGIWGARSSLPPVMQHIVTYKYKGELPSEVMATLPVDENGYIYGTKITAKSPTSDNIKVNNGVYKFAGWDKLSAIINDEELVFTGTWEFIEDSTNSGNESQNNENENNTKENLNSSDNSNSSNNSNSNSNNTSNNNSFSSSNGSSKTSTNNSTNKNSVTIKDKNGKIKTVESKDGKSIIENFFDDKHNTYTLTVNGKDYTFTRNADRSISGDLPDGVTIDGNNLVVDTIKVTNITIKDVKNTSIKSNSDKSGKGVPTGDSNKIWILVIIFIVAAGIALLVSKFKLKK